MKLQQQALNPFSWRHKFKARQGGVHDYNSTPPRPTTAINAIASPVADQTAQTRSRPYSSGTMDAANKFAHKDFAYQDSPVGDSFSAWSDAAGEPLVQDSRSDVIPPSARPLEQSKSGVRRLDHSDQHKTPSNTANRSQGYESTHQHGKQSIGSLVSSSIDASPRIGSSAGESFASSETAPSVHGLPPLQSKSVLTDIELLEPLIEDDPTSYELVEGPSDNNDTFSIEKRAKEMFSHAHLKEIFADPTSMLKFTHYLSNHRPDSVPVLIYYLDAVKSLKAIKYANAIAEALGPIPGLSFTDNTVDKTINVALEKRAQDAFDVLVREDLPAYISHIFVHVINATLHRRVTGTIPSHLRDASEGLAEVFCLTDPSRPDNPIVFASEEFHRTTQYGVDYCIGRNCRFLQGPSTSKDSIRRLSSALKEGREINELFINYRRDGSPFMNLLTVAPLLDSKGNIKYHIGAQVDITGLCKDMTDLDSLRKMLERDQKTKTAEVDVNEAEEIDEFQELTEMFNDEELEVVRRSRLQSSHNEDDSSQPQNRPRVHVRDPSSESSSGNGGIPLYGSISRGRNSSLFQNYLLVRPYPSLRILFASPALRTPGILQSPFLSRIGGSLRVRDELTAAMASGRAATAKVRWLSGRSADADGAPRWVHCTPLLGKSGTVGVWMVVLVDEVGYEPVRKFKEAPPVSTPIPRSPVVARSESGSRMGSITLHSPSK